MGQKLNPRTRQWCLYWVGLLAIQRFSILLLQWNELGVSHRPRQLAVGLLNDFFVIGFIILLYGLSGRLRRKLAAAFAIKCASLVSFAILVVTFINFGHIFFYHENLSLYQLGYLRDWETLWDSFSSEVSGAYAVWVLGALAFVFWSFRFLWLRDASVAYDISRIGRSPARLLFFLFFLLGVRSTALGFRLILHEPLETQIVTYMPYRIKLDLNRQIEFPNLGFSLLGEWQERAAAETARAGIFVGRKNVIFLMLESMAYATVLNGKQVTPFLNSIITSQEWTLLPHHVTNVYRTVGAQYSAQCSGYDPLAFYSIRDYPQIRSNCLASVLARSGYSTTFVSAGKEGFDNINEWSKTNGFQRVVTERDFPPDAERGSYGIHDEGFLSRVLTEANQAKEPFYINGITTSTHHPYILPANYAGKHLELAAMPQFQQAFFYTDQMLAKFWRQAKEQPWFKNTIFVMVGDHPHWGYSQREKEPNEDWYQFRKDAVQVFAAVSVAGNKVAEPQRITSHVDLAPTVLGMIGMDVPPHFVGSSVFSDGELGYVGTSENVRNTTFQIMNRDEIIEANAALDVCKAFRSGSHQPDLCNDSEFDTVKQFSKTFFDTTHWAIISGPQR